MAGRRKSRILAFQTLYAWLQSGQDLQELLDFPWLTDAQKARYGDDGLSFVRLLVTGTVENIAAIDKTISDNITNWDLSRLRKVDLSILRMSVYSLLYQKDIHPSIAIDEAIEISREYGCDDSYRFINGVLDSIRKKNEAKAQNNEG